MSKKVVIDEQTKRFVREVFEWIQTTGVEKGYFSQNWKNDLVEYIYLEMLKEGKIVKKESIRRNINRMISYYYNTGAQARSGWLYLKYFEKLFDSLNEQIKLAEGEIAQYFLTTAEARLYRGEIAVLEDIPDFKTLTIIVYRTY